MHRCKGLMVNNGTGRNKQGQGCKEDKEQTMERDTQYKRTFGKSHIETNYFRHTLKYVYSHT